MAATRRAGFTQRPTVVVELFDPPREPPSTDERWRPARPTAAEELTQQQRSEKAIANQCTNARVPGYRGFIPGARAESIYGRTECCKGQAAAETAVWRRGQQQERQFAASRTGQGTEKPWAQATRGESQEGAAIGRYTIDPPGSGAHERPGSEGLVGPSDHPLVASQAPMVRNHWVPTVPGYTGHIPGKGPEPVCGAGIIGTCRMAGRAIAERNLVQSALPPEEEKARLTTQIREHCSGKMPGYSGHVPRKHGESIFGARSAAAALLSAEYCEDRIYNPPPDGNIIIPKRKLRI